MALPFDVERLTFNVVGIREALNDTINDVSPQETPFLSNLGKAPNPQNTLWNWLIQSLAAPVTNNLDPEGKDYTTVPVAQPTKLNNNMQISSKAIAVSNTVEATKRAGRAGELARAMVRAGIELKRDIDSNLVSANQAKATGSSGVAGNTATILSWIKTNTDIGAAGANPAAADGTGTRTDGTQRAFTETILKNVLQLAWKSSGTPGKRVVYLGPVNIQRAAGFLGIAQMINEDPAAGGIYGAVDFYKGQFETVYFIPERNMRERDVLVICNAFVKLAVLRGYTPIDLAITGDHIGKAIVTEYGLQMDNELAHGGAFDLTTT